MDNWGHCLNCGQSSKEPYCQNCDEDLEGKCNECGKAFEEDVKACLDHIEEYEDLEKYARGLVVCRDKQIEEIRSLNAKIDGGVEHVKEQNSLIEALKGANKELHDLMNRLTYDSLNSPKNVGQVIVDDLLITEVGLLRREKDEQFQIHMDAQCQSHNEISRLRVELHSWHRCNKCGCSFKVFLGREATCCTVCHRADWDELSYSPAQPNIRIYEIMDFISWMVRARGI